MKNSKEYLGDKIYELEVADLELEGVVADSCLEKAVHRDDDRLAEGRNSTKQGIWRTPSDESGGRGQTKAEERVISGQDEGPRIDLRMKDSSFLVL